MTLATALATALCTATSAQTQITVDAGRGPVLVRLPSSYTGVQPVPLLVMLHAYLQTPAELETFMGITAAADAAGIATAHPIGLPDINGAVHWNATAACCAWFGPGNDDSGYLAALINEVELHANIAPTRIHVTGYSNGAFMAYRMACDHADKIASIASIGGATWNDPSMCTPSSPVHILHIHGDQDLFVNYNGGIEVSGNPYPSAATTLAHWVGYNGCNTTPTTSATTLDLDALVPGAETAWLHYDNGCSTGGSVEHWKMQGSNHFPVWQPAFAVQFCQWLLAHSKPGTWTDTGNDLAGAYGAPGLQPRGTANPGTTVTLGASNALENTAAVLVIGITAVNAPFAGGVLGPSSDLNLYGLVTDPFGDLNVNVPWPAGLPIGLPIYFQYWFQDAAGPAGLSSTTTWQLILP